MLSKLFNVDDAVKSFKKNKKILLSLSGGVDSVVLLDLLNKSIYKKNIFLLHINYNTDSHSSKSRALCLELSKIYNNKLFQINRFIDSSNFESKAREDRYKTLYAYSKKYNIDSIMTAHHYDDQIETLYMMKYIHKSNWVSMLGIREYYGKIYRPLLNVSKKSIYEYAKDKNLSWIEDDTNNNMKYLRNKVRHKLLPERKSKDLLIEKELISEHEKCKNLFKKTLLSINKDLDSKTLAKEHYITLNNDIIKYYDKSNIKILYQSALKKINARVFCSRSHWGNFYNFIKESSAGSKFYLSSNLIVFMDRNNHTILIDSYYNKINSLKKMKKIKINNFNIKLFDNTSICESDINYNITLPNTININDLFVRYWRPGDFCYSDYYKCNVKVKKLFINNKVSLINKLRTPILVNSNNKILAIPNLYNYKLNEECIKMLWEENE